MSVEIIHGDARLAVELMANESVDSVCTDPPYALVSIGKRFGSATAAPARSEGATGVYRRASAGFMGKTWDTGEVAFDPAFWAEVLRVLKPGGHVLAFGGTRTYHRLACAIEDAGFEIRDQVGWVYGTGFPKSHDAGAGWGTALKPAWEPIVLARKPLIGTVAENVARYGTGAINVDGCRVGDEIRFNPAAGNKPGGNSLNMSAVDMPREAEGRIALGRWPANVIHDGSDEVIAAFPTTTSVGHHPSARGKGGVSTTGHRGQDGLAERHAADSGSAARFFYCAKASRADRAGSKHPTVKPVSLIRYLCRLVTPPGGVVLDPFAGSGTTGQAARDEGFRAVLVEREAEYVADIRRRLGLEPAAAEPTLEDMLA